MMQQKMPLTVTEITLRIKQLLEGGLPSVSVQGELSNFKLHSSGHIYFTLKDAGAALSGVMWRSRAVKLNFAPRDGMKVIVSGKVSVYEVRGTYQLDATSIVPLGVGELQIAFEQLKQKLSAEGLFDEERKKPLPEYPSRIGIVTSGTGAALQDILRILRNRYPCLEVILAPVKVQGIGAAEDIAGAIDDFNAFGKVDVLIVGRGGGSLEDLWAFNEEPVARAIARSRIPVVSAVGHEVDFTIADFVADVRAATPSAAAALVVPDRRELLDIVRESWYTMQNCVVTQVQQRRESIRHLLRSYSFNRPIDLLRQRMQHFDELTKSMSLQSSHKLALTSARHGSLSQRLLALDPLLALKRGYAIVSHEGQIVTTTREVTRGDDVEIRFQDGTVQSTIQ